MGLAPYGGPPVRWTHVTPAVVLSADRPCVRLPARWKHTDWLARTGHLRERREARAGDEIEAIVLAALRRRMGNLRHHDSVDRLAADVVDGRTDPYAAADQVLDALT